MRPPVLESLNPGIRRTVALLRARGFRTCDSGDGETRDHPCDREDGYVVVEVEPKRLAEEADRLASVLQGAGVRVQAQELERHRVVYGRHAIWCDDCGWAPRRERRPREHAPAHRPNRRERRAAAARARR